MIRGILASSKGIGARSLYEQCAVYLDSKMKTESGLKGFIDRMEKELLEVSQELKAVIFSKAG